jgi:hypothetical protein
MSPQVTYPRLHLTTNQNFIKAPVGSIAAGIDLNCRAERARRPGATINRALPSDPDFPEERVTADRCDPQRGSRGTERYDVHLLCPPGRCRGTATFWACANVAKPVARGRALARRRERRCGWHWGAVAPGSFGHIFREGVPACPAGRRSGIALGSVGKRPHRAANQRLGAAQLLRNLAPFDSTHVRPRRALVRRRPDPPATALFGAAPAAMSVLSTSSIVRDQGGIARHCGRAR